MPVSVKQFFNENHNENDYYPRYRSVHKSQNNEKPCRACTDFKSWMKNQNEPTNKNETECPLNKSELGYRTWGFLHTMAAYFPEEPSGNEQKDMTQFLKLFSRFYPCPTCARDFSKLIERRPPETKSQNELKHWLCWAHNKVNDKLGKPIFDCSKLDERWKIGWKDGSCDLE